MIGSESLGPGRGIRESGRSMRLEAHRALNTGPRNSVVWAVGSSGGHGEGAMGGLWAGEGHGQL